MNLFEVLRTAFKIVASGLTQNSLFVIGLSVLVCMIAGSVMSLCFNSSVRFSKNSKVMIVFLKENSLNKENYPLFIEKFKKFPLEMRLAWKQYEIKKKGNASDYLNREDCFEAPLMGGIQKQSRSLMRTVIYFVLGLLTIFSVAIIGSTASSGSTNAVLTTTMLADAMIVPLIVFLLLMINYYIYTYIRNQEYRTANDYFLDLVDTLSDRVDLTSIFGEDSRSIGLISSVYANETIETINREARKRRQNEVREVRVGKGSIIPTQKGVLGLEPASNMADNVIETTDKFSTKLSSAENDIALDTTLESNFKIKNEVHFVEVVNCVEVLLNRAETETNAVKKQAIEREVNTLIKALTEYKQKAKKKSKKESK